MTTDQPEGTKPSGINLSLSSTLNPPEDIESGHWHRRDAVRVASEVVAEHASEAYGSYRIARLMEIATFIAYGGVAAVASDADAEELSRLEAEVRASVVAECAKQAFPGRPEANAGVAK